MQQPQRSDNNEQQGQNPLPPYAEPQRQNYMPPEVLRHVTSLSDPRQQTGDHYLLAPPPVSKNQSLPERAADTTLAAVSHFAIAFGFFGIGFLVSIAISAFIWLYSKRSPFVEFQSSQAGRYQCFVLVFNLLYVGLLALLLGFQVAYGWGWAGALFAVLLVIGVLWFFFSILYGVWGGIMVLMGKDFRYPYFGRDKR